MSNEEAERLEGEGEMNDLILGILLGALGVAIGALIYNCGTKR